MEMLREVCKKMSEIRLERSSLFFARDQRTIRDCIKARFSKKHTNAGNIIKCAYVRHVAIQRGHERIHKLE